MRFRTLYRSGPSRAEVTSRVTYDANSGETLGQPMKDYSTNSDLSALLPSPRPCSLRTFFFFEKTTATLPPDAQHNGPNVAQVPTPQVASGPVGPSGAGHTAIARTSTARRPGRSARQRANRRLAKMCSLSAMD